MNIHLTSLNTLLLHLIAILLNTYFFDVQLFYSSEVTFNKWLQPKVDITFCLVASVYHIFTNFRIILKYVSQWCVEKHCTLEQCWTLHCHQKLTLLFRSFTFCMAIVVH